MYENALTELDMHCQTVVRWKVYYLVQLSCSHNTVNIDDAFNLTFYLPLSVNLGMQHAERSYGTERAIGHTVQPIGIQEQYQSKCINICLLILFQ